MPGIWYIYHVKNCRHAKPTPKDKLVIIVCSDTKPWGFFINTGIRQFVQKQPELLVCQVSIKATNHKCLDYDSYVDCTELYPFEDTELLDVRDPVNKQTKAEIKKAVTVSKTIVERHQKLILAG
jgi:hypothetical protein